jgi:hypothetical protein
MSLTIPAAGRSTPGFVIEQQPSQFLPDSATGALSDIADRSWGDTQEAQLANFGAYLSSNVQLGGMDSSSAQAMSNILWTAFKSSVTEGPTAQNRQWIASGIEQLRQNGLSDGEARQFLVSVADDIGPFAADPLSGPVIEGQYSMSDANQFARDHWADHEANIYNGILSGAAIWTVDSQAPSLGAIAQSYYGKASRWPDIFRANQEFLRDADRIQPGWELVLPNP